MPHLTVMQVGTLEILQYSREAHMTGWHQILIAKLRSGIHQCKLLQRLCMCHLVPFGLVLPDSQRVVSLAVGQGSICEH